MLHIIKFLPSFDLFHLIPQNKVPFFCTMETLPKYYTGNLF